MNRLIVILLALSLLLGGTAAPVQAQRGYYGRPGRVIVVPQRPVYRQPAYGPRYYHAAPYRSYKGRSYYRPRAAYGRPGYYRGAGRRGRRRY